jgi:hypothetical protein
MIRLFKIQQSRLVRALYKREVWARDAAHAIQLAEQGTAWPSSYDEDRQSVECGEFSAEDVTTTGILRWDGGYPEEE